MRLSTRTRIPHRGGIVVRKHYPGGQDHDQSAHGNWASQNWATERVGEPFKLGVDYTIGREGPMARPISQGPGPVMSISEAQAWAKDSELPGQWWHGGIRPGGALIELDSRGMDVLGRGYYLTVNYETATGFGTGVKEMYINVDKVLVANSPEYDAIVTSPEYQELRGLKMEHPQALQTVAQRLGFQAYTTPTKAMVAVWDADRIAVTHDPHIAKHSPGGYDHDQSAHGNWAEGTLSVPATWSSLTDDVRGAVETKMAKVGLDMGELTDEIRTRVGGPDSELMDEGKDWYPEALAIAESIAEDTGIERDQVIAAMAAISARCNWEHNVELGVAMGEFYNEHSFTDAAEATDAFLDWYPEQNGSRVQALPDNVVKGFQLLFGADIDSTLGGTKVRSFFNNIANPGETDDVTVDAHQAKSLIFASDLAEKKEVETFLRSTITRDKEVVVGGVGYLAVAEAVRIVAGEWGESPDAVQAAYWLAIREEFGREWPTSS